MPTYEYSCLKCANEFEVFQSMKDAPLTVCNCGKKGKVRRKIGGGAGLIFKGSGFYETDYKRAAAPKSDGAAKTKDSPAAAPANAGSKSAASTPARSQSSPP